MTEPFIQATNLTKTFKYGLIKKTQFNALTGLNLQVSEGEILALLGPNGAGKSTAINVLMGFLRPTEGSVRVFGQDPEDPDVKARIGYLPEHYAFYSYMSAVQLLNYFGRLLKIPPNDLSKNIEEWLVRLDLWDARNKSIGSYSRGMRQRLGIIQALLNKPALLILDEPTSGFDPGGRRMVRDLLVELKKEGTSILLCSHILSEVELICDKVAIINKGQLVKEGTLSEILQTKSFEICFQDAEGQAVAKVKESNQEVASDGNNYTVRTSIDEEAQTLIRLVIENGGRLISFGNKGESLEEAFLSTVDESSKDSKEAAK
jgi:ABC-2 type transport system ATP-binding protein